MSQLGNVHIGTAGWTVPSQYAERFAREGSGLQRYAAVLNCTEINSTFKRVHKRQTFERWSSSTPEAFRFSVKIPKAISHEKRLIGSTDLVREFAEQTKPLGVKAGPWLLQLPPSLEYDRDVVEEFFETACALVPMALVCEPRHPSWFDGHADELLKTYGVARVAADPIRIPGATIPGGAPSLIYYRLHGSPRTYYSAYQPAFVSNLAEKIEHLRAPVWCIFDNTASGAAAGNALDLMQNVTVPTGKNRRRVDRATAQTPII